MVAISIPMKTHEYHGNAIPAPTAIQHTEMLMIVVEIAFGNMSIT